jgi:ABC-type sugar transport system substrate-binding protein
MKTKTVPVGLLAAAAVTATLGSAGFAAAADQVSIAVVEKTLSNPFWVTMKNGAEYAGTEIGARVEVQASTAENAVEEQSTLLQTMFAQGFDCYVVSSITETNLLQPLAAISAAGKPIVNVAAKVDDAAAAAAGIHFATFIDSDNVKAGQFAAEEMSKLLGGAGKIAIVGGLPGDVANRNRISGFEAGAGVLQIVQTVAADWDREKALTAATAILQANPDLGGFLASNDTMALGILQAIENAGRKDVRVIGIDGLEDAIKSVAAGGLTATVSQYPWAFGTLGVKACEAAIRGVELPDFVESPIAVITAANAEAALKAFPEPLEPIPTPF